MARQGLNIVLEHDCWDTSHTMICLEYELLSLFIIIDVDECVRNMVPVQEITSFAGSPHTNSFHRQQFSAQT